MAVETTTTRPPTRWSRTYPPLVFLGVAVLIAAFVLPSALNLPQSNPSTVLEYAPVPPEDDDLPNPPQGNLSSLGLGSSNTTSEGGLEDPPPPPPPDLEGSGTTPRAKQCVGRPLRQTEDPMSPPCVPFFDGDNFGATWQGVTGDEIHVVVYFDNGNYNLEGAPPAGEFYDMDEPPKPPCDKGGAGTTGSDPEKCDMMLIRHIKGFSRYFNARFQTYNRHVHYWAYFTNAGTEEARRADASLIWNEKRPFAVIDSATFQGFNEAFADALAVRGTLVFTQETALTNEFYVRNRPHAWGFWPDVKRWARSYVGYVCNLIVNNRVNRAGNPAYIGKERRYGVFRTSDRSEPGLLQMAELVKEGIEGCGITEYEEATFPDAGFAVHASDPGTEQANAVARFQRGPGPDDDVTTVLWPGGIEGKFSQAADGARYYPEIIFAGDLDLDNNVASRHQNQNAWRYARGTTFQLRFDAPVHHPGWKAYQSTSDHAPPDEARYAADTYRDHFMLFQAIQVAGPRLTPDTVDQGFHAIPENESGSPYKAAFFFEPDDYTSVKDAAEIWWDPSGQSPGSQGDPGCYRMVNEGKRYQSHQWPTTDDAYGPDDPCTGYEGARRLRA